MRRESILVLSAIVLLITSTVSADLFDGLVAYYPFNGNANNASGSGLDGTVNGATLTTDRFGNPNSAYSFNGTSDYIGVPYTNVFQLPSLTISVWVRPTVDLASLAGHKTIVTRGEDISTDHAAFGLHVGGSWSIGNGVVAHYEDNIDNSHLYTTDYYPQTNIWTHLAAT